QVPRRNEVLSDGRIRVPIQSPYPSSPTYGDEVDGSPGDICGSLHHLKELPLAQFAETLRPLQGAPERGQREAGELVERLVAPGLGQSEHGEHPLQFAHHSRLPGLGPNQAGLRRQARSALRIPPAQGVAVVHTSTGERTSWWRCKVASKRRDQRSPP